jgi:hypothetical protein
LAKYRPPPTPPPWQQVRFIGVELEVLAGVGNGQGEEGPVEGIDRGDNVEESDMEVDKSDEEDEEDNVGSGKHAATGRKNAVQSANGA